MADFSAIEARVIAWFAGEAWRSEVTYLGLEDAAEELKRMQELEKVRKEMYGEEPEKPMKQNMFKVV